MNELEIFIASLFADGMLTLAEGNDQNRENALQAIRSLIAERDAANNSVQSLTTEKTTLIDKITKLNAEVANLKDMATIGTNYIKSFREEVVGNYTKLKGDNIDQTIITMINSETTGLLTLQSLNKEYTQQLEDKFPLTCSACGSKDISRASSAKVEDTTTTQHEEQPANNSDLFSTIYKNKIK